MDEMSEVISWNASVSQTMSNLVTDLEETLKQGLPAVPDDPFESGFIHLSHTDLDGYGCSIVMAMQNVSSDYQKVNDGTCLPAGLAHMIAGNNQHYQVINTSKMMPQTLDVMKQYIALMNRSKSMTLLFTDFGSITVEALENWILSDKAFFRAYSPYYRIYVIDHHKTNTPKEFFKSDNGETIAHQIPRKTLCRYYNKKDDSLYEGAYYNDEEIRIDIDIITEYKGYSATKMMCALFEKCGCHFEEFSHQSVKAFADLVSKWDTGAFGNWFIPNYDGCENPKAKYRDAYYNDIADEVKLNTFMQLYYRKVNPKLFDEPYNPLVMRRFMIDMMSMLSVEDGRHSHIAREASDRIETKLVEDSKAYIDFERRALSYRLGKPIYAKIFKSWCGRILRSPIEGQAGGWFWVNFPDNVHELVERTCIYLAYTKEDSHIPFTQYAKLFFERHPDVPLLFMVDYSYHNTEDKIIINMRSHSDDVNCYEIAKMNEGGGHPRAAGFTKQYS